MRVLLTGGAGFIGGHLGPALLEAGHDLVVLDDLSTGRRERVPGEARFVEGSLHEPEALEAAFAEPLEAVLHLAARVSIRDSGDRWQRDIHSNLHGSLALLQQIADRGIGKFVFASSMAVYSDSPDGAPVPEGHPARPLSVYGASKLAVEHYGRLLCGGAGVDFGALRLFNTYGPGQAENPYVGVTTIFGKRLLRGEPCPVFGDGLQTRDFVSVDDVVAAFAAALARPLAGASINIGTGRGTTVLGLHQQLARLIDPAGQVEHLPARAEELRHSVPSIDLAREVLGWEPRQGNLALEPLVAHWREELD